MMYKNMLVACLKANGKILREFGDTVRVPFGTEFSILLKNLNTVRAQVTISIDGEPVTERCKLVIGPNEDFELTRYIKNGNRDSGNRFKFIERTAGIEQHRGVKVDDGIVRIEFQFERKALPDLYRKSSAWPRGFEQEPYWLHDAGSVQYDSGMMTKGISNTPRALSRTLGGDTTRSAANVTMDFMNSDTGITVPGSVSNQQFQNAQDFAVEFEKHVIVLKMLGEIGDNQPITQPITVKVKNTCTTCGFVNPYKAKFCAACGTSLTIV